MQSLREFGALASKHLQPGADALSPVSSRSLCSILSPVFCLPGAKFLITVIPHVPHLNFTKAVIHPLSHTLLPKRQGQSRIRPFLLSPPPHHFIIRKLRIRQEMELDQCQCVGSRARAGGGQPMPSLDPVRGHSPVAPIKQQLLTMATHLPAEPRCCPPAPSHLRRPFPVICSHGVDS